jgi:sialic acid synthase SpsE
MTTFVVCEAAATHDGDLDKAYRLIELAAEIHADACKFQWCSSPERLAERRRAPEYLDAYRLLAFPREWLPKLAAHARAQGLEFLCTVYLPEDVPTIAEHVSRFKISSFEATDVPFVALHGCWPEKPLIISAGMGASLGWSRDAYRNMVYNHDPQRAPDITILHCRSAYPCPDDQLGLAALHTGYDGHQPRQGFSDHSRNPRAGAYAVAAGARVVEFHVRLEDTSPNNADYAVARTPDEAREYVRLIREAEMMLGDSTLGSAPAEEPFLRYRVGVGA